MTFRLKTLFIAVTVAAILLAIFFALPLSISMFVCGAISVLAPAGFVTWIVYGRGYGRAFAIGCTTASAVLLFSTGLGTLLLTGWYGAAAEVTGDMEGILSPLSAFDPNDAAENVSTLGILFVSPYPLCFSLVLLSGGLSMLVRWLTQRERCLLE